MFIDKLHQKLAQQKSSGRWRTVITRQQGQGRYLIQGDQRWLNFASNDYLGFAQHPKVKQAAIAATQSYGVGSGGSALITGHHQVHAELEARIKELTNQPRVLLFSSGYAANQAALTTVVGEGDLIVQDKLNHASLIDGGQASKASSVRFIHNDLDSANRQIKRKAQAKLLVTESVFSMDGDQSPVHELSEICRSQNALLMVDDAHGLGVIGNQGQGACHLAGHPNIDIYMATFGKAMGVGGAMLACSEEIADYLTQFGRHFIYTTAMPIPQAAATCAALDCLDKEPQHWLRLQENIHLFRKLAEQADIPLMPSVSAIQPIPVSGNNRVMACAQALHQQGIVGGAIRAPTVKAGEERLRLTLSASHTPQDIEQCVCTLARVLNANSGVVS